MAKAIPFAWWKYLRALGPAVAFWLVLVASLAYLLIERTQLGPSIDEADLHEWLDESRTFRKTTAELVREYAQYLDSINNDPTDYHMPFKQEEIYEQLRALVDPLRLYQAQLPLFPEVYRLEVRMTNRPEAIPPIIWESPVPQPRRQNQEKVRPLVHPIRDSSGNVIAMITCEYRIHVFNTLQRDEQQRQRIFYIAGGVVLVGSLLAIFWVYLFLQKERRQELTQLEAENAREHAEVLMLEARIAAAEAEKATKEAEQQNLEIKSQLYASIGIMAGSYAHNIKNLLVRPNDLIARCLEGSDLPTSQTTMLNEVKGTLATVTDRLQMILRTVRRDPSKNEMTPIDLNSLLKETEATWGTIAREKWKMALETTPAPVPAIISGDLSHLQQAIENLVFNARDATFEMRNHVRVTARSEPNPERRKQALIDAAAWRGMVSLRVENLVDSILFIVQDNGIGMTEEVREKCLETHFTTKRNNALYEGYNAGMGLGLSFVNVVLEHHQATLAIESHPQAGTTFIIQFPKRPID